ncbi:MAG: HPr(Ser) kinase/phosphatase [Acidobacteriota bacterium]
MAKDSENVVFVSELLGEELSDLHLTPLCREDRLDNEIFNPRVQKPGLAFAGYLPYIKPGRVQIVGESETAFLATMDDAARRQRFDQICALSIPVFIITKGIDPFPQFVELCEAHGIPILSSPDLSSVVIKEISYFLEEHLVPSTTLHGVLLEIYGLGVLLIGRSGVGKSECALDLLSRGHSLVADDRVTVKRYPNGDLLGYCKEPLRYHMELRGLGIVNVKDLFGLAAVRQRKSIDLVVELEPWQDGTAYERLGLDESLYEILEVPCPHIKMPIATGRNLAILVEIAARNHVLKLEGHHSAREFAKALEHEIETRNEKASRRSSRSIEPVSTEPAASADGGSAPVDGVQGGVHRE